MLSKITNTILENSGRYKFLGEYTLDPDVNARRLWQGLGTVKPWDTSGLFFEKRLIQENLEYVVKVFEPILEKTSLHITFKTNSILVYDIAQKLKRYIDRITYLLEFQKTDSDKFLAYKELKERGFHVHPYIRGNFEEIATFLSTKTEDKIIYYETDSLKEIKRYDYYINSRGSTSPTIQVLYICREHIDGKEKLMIQSHNERIILHEEKRYAIPKIEDKKS